jgi:hypothetical protein
MPLEIMGLESQEYLMEYLSDGHDSALNLTILGGVIRAQSLVYGSGIGSGFGI